MVCNKVKEHLEEFFEQMVDANPAERNSGAQALPPFCLAHLSHCEACRNYQSANLMLLQAATAMPLLAVRESESLSADIMAAVMAEPEPSLSPFARAAASKKDRELVLLAAAFAGFAIMSAAGSNFDESICSSASWLISLLAILALRPLIENDREKASV